MILNTHAPLRASKDAGLPAEDPVGFESCRLDDQNSILRGELPNHLVLNPTEFQQLWEMHPADFHLIKMHGRLVATPRWQQAFGRDYDYSGQVNFALPVPPILEPFLAWGCREIDTRLNGILVNWYDGQEGHYIGKHRDSTVMMIEGAPIVTISLGEERAFRMRPWKGNGFIDFLVRDGTVIVTPYATNKHWTHEVPHSRNRTGRRISITLRGFMDKDVGESSVSSEAGGVPDDVRAADRQGRVGEADRCTEPGACWRSHHHLPHGARGGESGGGDD